MIKSSIISKLVIETSRCMSSLGAKPTVYMTRIVPDPAKQILVDGGCEVSQWPEANKLISREELLRNIRGKDALYCLITDRIDEEVLDAAGLKIKTKRHSSWIISITSPHDLLTPISDQLKVVGTMSVGYDHVDVEACRRRGIKVGYTPGVLTDATAELAVSLLLATSRRIVEGAAEAKNGGWGSWSPLWLCGQGLANKTVGLVGLGRIGLGIAQRLRPFNIDRLLYTDAMGPMEQAKQVNGEFVNMDTLLAESDFVVACCAVNELTVGMFDKDKFAKMKESAIFVNFTRGGLVVQDDLVEALRTNQIRSAGLDVTTPEPLPLDHPLLALPNCLVIPHMGSATVDTRTDMATLTSRNIVAALRGQPLPAQVQ